MNETKIEFIINEDGSIMLPRGDLSQNNLVRNIFNTIVTDSESLDMFLKVTDENKQIFGNEILCG